MATIGTLKTLIDWSKQVDPDGSTAAVAELLSQNNGIVKTMLMQEGNLPTGHRVTQRTGLPTTYWRLMNQGVPTSKATTTQVDEQCGTASQRGQIDVKVAKLNGNTPEFRAKENVAFIESMRQEVASTMFYGSAANPEEFIGLANRYNDLSAGNADNIIDAGGSGSDNLSVWLVGWGDGAINSIFPKGGMGGLQHEDLGIQDAFDSNNNRFRAYMDDYSWDVGLCVEDWRYGVRIANVDVSDLQGLTGTQASSASTELIKCMSRSIDRLQSLSGIKPCFYVPRTAASYLRVAALEKSSSAVTIEEGLNQFGQTIFTTKVLGIPVEIEDALLKTEAAVS